MQRTMLKGKIHRARVTEANLEYAGSLTIDQDLMDAADILEYEQIKIYNVSNGARFDTYAIAGPRGSGAMCLNGAAARLGARGDIIIIVTYGTYEAAEICRHQPKIVLVNADNQAIDPASRVPC
jgi:aspartate 1-decarboxylase